MKYFVFSLGCVLLFKTAFVYALTDDLLFRIRVGDDFTPPTTPVLTTVTPVAFDQMNIAWSSSTDDWIFGGYVLLRDGIPIATTTITSYTDTSLTAERVYTYAVYAFDAAGNVSTTSNSVSATTLSVPPVPDPEVADAQTESTLTTKIARMSVTTKATQATLRWTTNTPVRYLLRWGRTDTFSGGYVTNDVYQTVHETTITDLEPGTRYEYEVIGYTPTGRALVLERGNFLTQAVDLGRVIGNVERLEVVTFGPDVQLTFRLPEMEPGAQVRVVRSYLGFPVDLNDGAIVYEGVAQSVFDRDAFVRSPVQFYTVFVITSDGRISSGAVAIAYAEPADDLDDGEAVSTTTDPNQGTREPTVILPDLKAENIRLRQGSEEYTFLDDLIQLSAYERLTVTIPREALPRNLKTIVVSIVDPSDQRQRYAFLLRLNSAGTAYEATIEPLRVFGESRVEVEVYDYERMVIGRYTQAVRFAIEKSKNETVVFPDAIIATIQPLAPSVSGVLGILTLFGLLAIFWRRQAEDKA